MLQVVQSPAVPVPDGTRNVHSSHRTVRVIAGAVFVAAGLLATGTVAQAEPITATTVEVGPGLRVPGTLEGLPVVLDTLSISTDAGEAYCIDLETAVEVGDVLDEVPGELARGDLSADAMGRIRAVAVAFPPDGGTPLPASGEERRAAVQAAIWNLSDGFELTVDGLDRGAPVALEQAYVEVLSYAASTTSPEVAASLTVVDVPGESVAGAVVGPVGIHTTAPTVTVTVTGGSVVDAAGEPLSGPFADGDRFWLLADAPGEMSVAVTAEVMAQAGLTLAAPGVQSLVVASGLSVPVTESFVVVVTAAEPPAGVEPDPQPQPSVQPVSANPSLPNTGLSAMNVAGVGMALVVGGAVAVAASSAGRRRTVSG